LAILEARRLNAGYGAARVLFDVELAARRGEVVALLGRNGAGKSTTLKTLMGLIRPLSARCISRPPHRRREPFEVARAGLGYVPEDRRIFTDLTVAENLEVGRQPPRAGRLRGPRRSCFNCFPRSGRCRGGAPLSCPAASSRCCALRHAGGNPKAILLDAPSEGSRRSSWGRSKRRSSS